MFLLCLIIMSFIPINVVDAIEDICGKKCYEDGRCFELECNSIQEAECVYCQLDTCTVSCPCVSAETGCTGYGEGEYCREDSQCSEGLYCSGHNTFFVDDKACCPKDKWWDSKKEKCVVEVYERRVLSNIFNNQNGVDNSTNSCNFGFCINGDANCDGEYDFGCSSEDCIPASESCNKKDDDCDGVVDDGACNAQCKKCGDGLFNLCDKEECELLGSCVYSELDRCNAITPENFLVMEVCNGVDDDGDGLVDEVCEYYEEIKNIGEDIGLKKRGEFFCNYDGQCNPGLKCTNTNAYEQGGACCYEWESWDKVNRECVDSRIGENQKGCEEDTECGMGLHCSWDGYFDSGYCCKEGEEWDASLGKCTECGVLAYLGDSDYCSQKKEVECACKSGEGECSSDNECFAGSYCSKGESEGIFSFTKSICCEKGSYYNQEKDSCVESNIGKCVGDTKQECFSSSKNCDFLEGKCVEKTNIKRNDRFCTNDSDCCDRDNGCDNSVDLICAKGACCYPWEDYNKNTGRCYLKFPDADDDADGYENAMEFRFYSNPLVEDDTPNIRLRVQQCGSFFEIPGLKERMISSDFIFFSPADIMYPKSNDPNKLGKIIGILVGAVGGIKDDVEIISFIVQTGWKLLKFHNFLNENPESAKVRTGYSCSKFMDAFDGIFSKIESIFIEMLNGLSEDGENINIFYKGECENSVFIKAYVKYYVAGYLLEQIAMAMIGVSQVTATLKTGLQVTKIGRGVLKAVDVVKKALKYLNKVDIGLVSSVVKTVKKLKLSSIASWTDDTIKALAKVIKYTGSRLAKKIISEAGEKVLKEVSSSIFHISKKYGDDFVKVLVKSDVGEIVLKNGWDQDALEITGLLLKNGKEDDMLKILGNLNSRQIKSLGKKIGKGSKLSKSAKIKKILNAKKVSNSLGERIQDELLEYVDNAFEEITDRVFDQKGVVKKASKYGDFGSDVAKKASGQGDDIARVGGQSDDLSRVGGQSDDVAKKASKETSEVISNKNKLFDELSDLGIRYNKDKVIKIIKKNNKIIWLEKGNLETGLKHIMNRHADDFVSWGLKSEKEVSEFIMKTVYDKIGSVDGNGLVYDILVKGVPKKLKVVISENGYIVTAFPKKIK